MLTPVDVQIIGSELALRWNDGRETYYPAARLRAASPSAETQGERDIFGQHPVDGTAKSSFKHFPSHRPRLPALEKSAGHAVANLPLCDARTDRHNLAGTV